MMLALLPLHTVSLFPVVVPSRHQRRNRPRVAADPYIALVYHRQAEYRYRSGLPRLHAPPRLQNVHDVVHHSGGLREE
ncbi:hypothetical protein ACLOJK_023427 [Asimina triloba]